MQNISITQTAARIIVIFYINISEDIHIVDKNMKTCNSTLYMHGVCILASFTQLTLTLAALCLRIKHTYFDFENMPLESVMSLIEYPQ